MVDWLFPGRKVPPKLAAEKALAMDADIHKLVLTVDRAAGWAFRRTSLDSLLLVAEAPGFQVAIASPVWYPLAAQEW